MIAVACFAMALIGFGIFLYHFNIYREADRSIETVAENIKIVPPEDPSFSLSGSRDLEVTYPNLEIDYGNLSAINPDFIGVLYIPVLDLVYPVVHSHDNLEYLKTMFDGTGNNAGSIFLSMDSKGDLSSFNSIIFGHNMRNGSMFAPLKRFLEEDGLCVSDPYVYLYTPDEVRKYHIFAYYVAQQPDVCYADVENYRQYNTYVDTARKRSLYDASEDPYEDDFRRFPNILTLSTCGNDQGTRFTVINAAFVGAGNSPY